MQEEAARRSMRFAKTGARMIRIGAAILLAVLASAAPGQIPPASQSEAETPKAAPTVGDLDLSAINQRADAECAARLNASPYRTATHRRKIWRFQ